MARRELRRARKAVKNRETYKRFGRRPWNTVSRDIAAPIGMYYVCISDCPGWRCYCDHFEQLNARRSVRMDHLREPSGFSEVDKVAERIKRSRE